MATHRNNSTSEVSLRPLAIAVTAANVAVMVLLVTVASLGASPRLLGYEIHATK